MKNRIQLIVTCIGLTISILHSQTEYITINSNTPIDTNTDYVQGFINGGASYNIPLTQHLNPSQWGFGWDVVADYDYAVPNFNIQSKMASIYSAYMSYFSIGDPMTLQPWTDGYVQWDAFVNNMVNVSITSSRPVDYWSVWGEPDASFSGTPAQYIELFKRTDSIIHVVDPGAKMVGPDIIHFGIEKLIDFVDTLHTFNIHPAAISWHEFINDPESIPQHVQQFKDSLTIRPWAGNPQIHIQEYGDPDNRLIPGWAVGWLHYFEEAKVDWASRACFNEYDGVNIWDDCWDGLSGMYMMDGITPQPLYWVHRAYANINSNNRIDCNTSHPRTISMAGKNNTTEEIKIIVGRFYNQYQGTQDPSANVQIKIRNYPYGNNSTQNLLIQKIPAQSVAYTTPLLNPVTVTSSTINFTGDSATLTLNNFADGDAYIIYINPDANHILSTELPINNGIEIYPNPASSFFTINTEDNIVQTTIFDMKGRIVYQNSQSFTGSFLFSTTMLTRGVYSVQLTDETGNKFNKKLVIN